MKPREIREKSTQELTAALRDVHKHLSNLHFDLASGRVKNVKEAANLRREAARIQTVLHEREHK